ncbi:hypothetical protein MK805_01460 [Shimazuella sp. AN120528]|uniref:5' nucleotidase, NT5C type n=1 Tax=Shimazuella soli TaxID=1892854 RepID=UPI001F0FC2CF|nr:hypothetical protein [Shimazuella soli]MCH5583638.1 hypothetical protein [Shimazuella soli]
MKLRFGIDIDGTIKDTHRAAVEIYNKEFGKAVLIEDVPDFYLDKPFGLTPQEGRKTWRRLEEKIYTLGLPLPHASEVLNNLVKEGHEVYFITARPGMEKIRRVTKVWLKKHNFPYNGSNLHMNSINKAKVAKKLGIDLFFEDAEEHLNKLVSGGIPTIVVDACYNRHLHPNLPRITDWRDVYEIVEKLQELKKC